MNQSNSKLKINDGDYVDYFMSVDIDKQGQTLVINLNVGGVKLFYKIIEDLRFSNIIDISEFLTNSKITNFTPVSTFILYKAEEKTEPYTLAANYSPVKNAIYLLICDSGLIELKTTLSFLLKKLEANKTDDVSYMIDEWGGSGLTNTKFIENTDVVGHMRLYAII